MSNLQRTPVETLHHIATFAEQMSQQAQRGDLPFIAYLLSMASQEARAELKKAGFPMPPDQAVRADNIMQ
ncbi:hypothetical protein KL86PLE_90600 [uncultured Pleomorphomonas sp.]|uniref:Uncharacterized protein n=2 Tax=Pleomorphomonas TaxID=261933 RepID=A0A2G9WPF9_9HYPH|nr:hypothetical protein [Pleomorphomonas carboxyditropha]PIO96601.1 hypothetical protein CJ014_24440 [Pleomorphomonas carboxyditropha]SCM79712.1 hypothetical protein KL86PLE_90600 [uncultured Pleomorphomonas sp.]